MTIINESTTEEKISLSEFINGKYLEIANVRIANIIKDIELCANNYPVSKSLSIDALISIIAISTLDKYVYITIEYFKKALIRISVEEKLASSKHIIRYEPMLLPRVNSDNMLNSNKFANLLRLLVTHSRRDVTDDIENLKVDVITSNENFISIHLSDTTVDTK